MSVYGGNFPHPGYLSSRSLNNHEPKGAYYEKLTYKERYLPTPIFKDAP